MVLKYTVRLDLLCCLILFLLFCFIFWFSERKRWQYIKIHSTSNRNWIKKEEEEANKCTVKTMFACHSLDFCLETAEREKENQTNFCQSAMATWTQNYADSIHTNASLSICFCTELVKMNQTLLGKHIDYFIHVNATCNRVNFVRMNTCIMFAFGWLCVWIALVCRVYRIIFAAWSGVCTHREVNEFT